MVAETILTPNDFIVPLFIDEGTGVKTEIASMPGYFRQSIDGTVTEVKELWSLGIKCVLLFVKSKDELKDNTGQEAWNPGRSHATQYKSHQGRRTGDRRYDGCRP